jgi:hypothetical protein
LFAFVLEWGRNTMTKRATCRKHRAEVRPALQLE